METNQNHPTKILFGSYRTRNARNTQKVLANESELVLLFQKNKDNTAISQLAMSHKNLIIHLAKKYSGYGLDHDDLVAEGNVGFVKAVGKFDINNGTRLSSFAAFYIKSEIGEFVIKNFSMIKIATTKNQRKLFFNLRKAKTSENSLSSTEANTMAENLNVQTSEITDMEQRFFGSSKATESPFDETCANEFSCDNNSNFTHEIERDNLQEHQKRLLTSSIEQLNEREQYIIQKRWLDEKQELYSNLANKFDISVQRIQQIEKGARKKLMNHMNLSFEKLHA